MSVATLTHTTTTNDAHDLSTDEISDVLADEASTISALFTEYQEMSTSANAAQVAAGERLNIVYSLRSVLFTDEEGEELSSRGMDIAFRGFWNSEGLTKDFVSRAMKAAELADIVGTDVASNLNAEMVKKLLPVAFENTASGKPRKLEVRKSNTAKVLAKAEELADDDEREIAGRHIAAARESLNIAPAAPRSTEHTLSVRAVVRAATLRENSVLSFVGVTQEDIDSLKAFMVTVDTGWTSRLEEMAKETAESDSQE